VVSNLITMHTSTWSCSTYCTEKGVQDSEMQ